VRRKFSRAAPAGGVNETEGLDYLMYRFRKEIQQSTDGAEVGDKDVFLTREQFMNVLEDVLYGEGQDGGGSYALGGPQTSAPDEQRSKICLIFDTFDREKADKVRLSEFLSGLCIILGGEEQARLDFAFAKLDTDGDGKISKEEFLGFFRDYFTAKLHVDHKRKLSEERWKTIKQHLERSFRGCDRDHDGGVDIQEFCDAIRKDPDHPFSLILDSFHTLQDTVMSPARRNHRTAPTYPPAAR